MEIQKFLPGIKKNILLKNYTTFKIGGKANYFFVAENKKNLISAVKAAKKFKISFFVLGGGSNLLIPDKGYKGLVIKVDNKKLKIKKNKKIEIFSEAGTTLTKLVSEFTKKEISSLEWATGIPGTLGGAIYGNTGAFGKSIKDNIKEVEVFDSQRFKIRFLKNKDCKFSYRNSIFRNKKNLIIISAKLKGKSGNKKDIRNKIKRYLNEKKQNQPLSFYSAGSIFKNPKRFSAAYLIEKCNLKGKREGNVKISEKHANFIVNLGNGRARDVKKLINFVKKEVKNRFKIKLEKEVCFLNKF